MPKIIKITSVKTNIAPELQPENFNKNPELLWDFLKALYGVGFSPSSDHKLIEHLMSMYKNMKPKEEHQ